MALRREVEAAQSHCHRRGNVQSVAVDTAQVTVPLWPNQFFSRHSRSVAFAQLLAPAASTTPARMKASICSSV